MRRFLASFFAAFCFSLPPLVEGAELYRSASFRVDTESVHDGRYEARALSPTEIESNYAPDGKGLQAKRWKLREDVSAYPQLHSGQTLVDALYNLSLEELKLDVRTDRTFMAGAKWEGVWTRDISYSILLSLAALEPEVAKASLLRKVARERIIQDTGTGGSWPVSTDRMVWALAAWEVYCVTGDREWLSQAYEVVRNSADDDAKAIFAQDSGLALGESTFLDWREQTYPRWMTPVDIYQSVAIGTNAVQFRTYQILQQMAKAMNKPEETYGNTANRIRDGINRRLWLDKNGYYGQFLYGGNEQSLSPRSEALGEALAVIFDIASKEQQARILENTPVMDYGIPCIYPQIPNIPPYHNNAIWPFVQAFWNLAAARVRNDAALQHGLASLYRASALFLSNQENFVADTGSSLGTEINSPRQLWSVAGQLAMILRLRFGMSFEPEGIHLAPVIPQPYGGMATLKNFKYRGATLDFEVEGFGAEVQSATLDEKPLSPVFVSGNLEGKHSIRIVMSNRALPPGKIHMSEMEIAPDTPLVSRDAAILHWARVPNADHYVVVRDGKRVAETASISYTLPVSPGLSEYQVSAVSRGGTHSFLSRPVLSSDRQPLQSRAPGAPVEITRGKNTTVFWKVKVPASGKYAVDIRYANGSGPINTDNKCAIRTLEVDGKTAGVIVMPQRGTDAWSDWGYSSSRKVVLTAGEHQFSLRFEPANENMNGDVNRALLESLRLMPVQ